MKIGRLFLGALLVGLISLVYNYLIFQLFNFYPDLIFELEFLPDWLGNFYVIIFVKNFIVGLVLMVLYSLAYGHIINDTGKGYKQTMEGVFYFILYAMFAMFAFTFGDIFLMKSTEGMLVLLSLDGFVEAFIATIPIRFYVER